MPQTTLIFPCSLDELVKDSVNGLVFHDAQQLATQLEVRLSSLPIRTVSSPRAPQSLLRGFPSAPALAALRASFDRAAPLASASAGTSDWEWGTWAENWNHTMRPLLLRDVAGEAPL